MLPELKKIAVVTMASTVVGAIFGLFIGALADAFLFWILIWAAVGFTFGVALAYGFLPES
jgi:hypothetical protein